MNKTLYWTPRAFGILFVVFVSLFALDVFGEDFSWLALLIHLLPTLILLVILIVSWKWPKIGGIFWILIGLFYILMTRGGQHYTAYLVLTLPAVVMGVLFLMQKSEHMPAKPPAPEVAPASAKKEEPKETQNPTSAG